MVRRGPLFFEPCAASTPSATDRGLKAPGETGREAALLSSGHARPSASDAHHRAITRSGSARARVAMLMERPASDLRFRAIRR